MIYCIFCKTKSKKFLPAGENSEVLSEFDVVGGDYRENVICPICYSRDRDRSILHFLKEKTDILSSSGLSILHASPAFSLKQVLSNLNQVEYLETYLNNNGKNMQLDLTRIPFPDEFFDVIVANHILEHIPNDRLAISEIFRCLKSGGRAILQVPFSLTLSKTYENEAIGSDDKLARYGQTDHVRIYGNDYIDRLNKVGFKVKKYNIKESMGIEYVKINGLIEDEVVFDILK